MLRVVHQRLTLYKVLHQTLGGIRLEPTDPPAPRSAQGLVEEMLRSLRRVSMALQGVETRPGHPRVVGAPWRLVQTLPQPGQPIDVLMQYVAQPGVPEVYNPLHPGFGPSAWVSEGGFYDPLMGQVGAIVLAAETGTVTHWRPAGAGLPDSALDGALMAEVPSTPQEVRAWLRDFAGVEATLSPDNGLADRYTLSAWTLIQALRERARWVPTRVR